MHGEFLRPLFLQAHRETEAHFIATGTPSQRNQWDSFRYKSAAFYWHRVMMMVIMRGPGGVSRLRLCTGRVPGRALLKQNITLVRCFFLFLTNIKLSVAVSSQGTLRG